MRAMQNFYARRMLLGFLRGLILVAGCFAALTVVVCGLIVAQGQRDEARKASAAIVLGAAQWNGDPSPVLRARLDHALDLYRRGAVSRIILTGGVGPGDALSEAAAGKQYLIEQRLPAEALLLDERSTTTWENLENAAE